MKLNLESKDVINENIQQLSQLFPGCISEQNGEKKIDFEKLKYELSNMLIDETKEKYELSWPGKRAAINEARINTNKTLLPLKGKSVNFENTNNVYIEGDNLDVLKILQESYLNKVKCIYIDPPYNTGKDFIYKDDFKQSVEDELIQSGQIDEEGNKFVQNTETNGRYHSDWLSMMYARLKLARNLLKDNGVIFISIDDNEVHNLKKLCDEIFGETNFISEIAWRRTDNQANIGTMAKVKEYILMYGKNRQLTKLSRLPLSEKAQKEYRYKDDIGYFRRQILLDKTRGRHYYDIKTKGGNILSGPWMIKEDAFWELESQKGIYWTSGGGEQPYGKLYLSDSKGQIPNDFWGIEFGTNQRASNELDSLFKERVFDFSKPTTLIESLCNIGCTSSNDIVLDFFSGSSTTAHAAMQLNGKDNGNRKYIMVQLPETIDEKNSKAAYDFCIENELEPIIPSIAQERIKRAGAKIKEETGADIDYGFRVFKLSDSILKANEILPTDLQQDLLAQSDSKYVDGISKLDIVTSVILDLGLMLDSKIENLGNDNFVIEEDLLFISLTDKYDESTIKEIAHILPDQVVLDEKLFNGDDALMTNVIQKINEISSDITINIL